MASSCGRDDIQSVEKTQSKQSSQLAHFSSPFLNWRQAGDLSEEHRHHVTSYRSAELRHHRWSDLTFLLLIFCFVFLCWTVKLIPSVISWEQHCDSGREKENQIRKEINNAYSINVQSFARHLERKGAGQFAIRMSVITFIRRLYFIIRGKNLNAVIKMFC